MTFRITFLETDARSGMYKAAFKIADFSFSSPPQDVPWLFRDVIANTQFLSEKKLAKFFFSEEPMANIRYNKDRIEAYVFRRVGSRSVKLCGDAPLGGLLLYLNHFMDSLEPSLEVWGTSRGELEAQVQRDISQGVYEVYLNT